MPEWPCHASYWWCTFSHFYQKILWYGHTIYRPGKWVMKTTNCGNNKPYEPLCARPVTRVDLAAPLLLLFPLAGMKDDLPAVWLPFFLSLFLLVLNSDIKYNFKLVKLQKPFKLITCPKVFNITNYELQTYTLLLVTQNLGIFLQKKSSCNRWLSLFHGWILLIKTNPNCRTKFVARPP